MAEEINFYKQAIKQLLSTYEALETNNSKVILLFDDARQSYMVVRVGWLGQKRIHLCLVHIDICENMVVVQANNTEDMIASELVYLGIPREKIQLGFLPPQQQAFSESALSPAQWELV